MFQIIFLLYPETKGRPLEEMDELFGKADAVQRMAEQAQEEPAELISGQDTGKHTGLGRV